MGKSMEKNHQNTLKRRMDLRQLTLRDYNKKCNKTKQEKRAFAIEKHKYLFLKFIKEKEVFFDNNQAERDLKMIKVKQKIAYYFRQTSYSVYFYRIRSYLSTLNKNQQNILENMNHSLSKKYFFILFS